MKNLPRSIFLSHGGGPLPLLGDPLHKEMVAALEKLARAISRPRVIVVVSAHWEADVPTITGAERPPLIYDYSGFPPESYKIQYPCVGEPSLAKEIFRRLADSGIQARIDNARGLDHGVFVPLKIMYPEADIPCVQVSLVSTLDPDQHIGIGQALQGLHEQDVLLIGSGFSFHNLKAFFKPNSEESRQLNKAFEDWLENICSSTEYTEPQRRDLLRLWEGAPGARYCHPREEHLLPLHVCYGASQVPCTKRIEITIMNTIASLYVW